MQFKKRLKNQVALIVGGGQIPGETIGNGRATALTFAKEGAKIVIADIDINSAKEILTLGYTTSNVIKNLQTLKT